MQFTRSLNHLYVKHIYNYQSECCLNDLVKLILSHENILIPIAKMLFNKALTWVNIKIILKLKKYISPHTSYTSLK